MIALFNVVRSFLGGWKIYALAGVVFVAAVAGAYVKGRLDGAAICDGRLAVAAADYDEARDAAVAKAEAFRAAVAQHLADIDTKHTKEMADAQVDLDSLRAAVAAGRKRLRVVAQCPAPAGVPSAAGGAGVDTAPAPELGPDAREAYYDLRRQHREVTERLLACQGILAAERGK